MSQTKLISSHRIWVLLLLIGFSPILNGCFIKSIAINSVADGLAGEGDTFASDNDPVLVGDAIPFSLKFMESILASTPHHVGLLTTLCQSFTEYGYAYVQSESEYIADHDYDKSKELNARAKNLYVRARDYGLRGLDARHDHFSKLLMEDPKAAVLKANKDDLDLLYWTGLSWMAAISIGKDDPELVSDVPQAEALIYRVYAINPDYNNGALHDFLITYEGGKPEMMGGSVKKAKEHFDRALELNKGQSASTFVNYAEAVDEKQQNREEFDEMLNKALEIDVDKQSGTRLVNLITQKRARWLLAHEDSIFAK